MLAIGCTGGIGAGKSTVAGLLAERGAVVLDADRLARDALATGTVEFGRVLERFGPLLLPDGSLDRRALATVVFSDPSARRDLETIVHPAVEAGLIASLAEHSSSDRVVVLDVALLLERDGRERYGLDGVIVVDAPTELCVERLVAFRNLDEQDATARIAAQMDRFERLGKADFVILNIGTATELALMVDQAWSWIETLAKGKVA